MSALRRFLRWWGGELAALAPAGLRRRLAPRRDRLLVRRGDAGLTLELARGPRLDLLGRLDALPPRRVRRLARAARAGRLDVALVGAPGDAALRRVSLPLAAEAELDAVLALDLDRLTPFEAGELFTDHRILARRTGAGRLDVALHFTARPRWADALAALEAAGLTPRWLDVAGQDGAPAGLRLRGPGLAAAPTGGRLAALARLGAVALVAVLLAAAVRDGLALQRQADALAAQAEAARARAMTAARADAGADDPARLALRDRAGAPPAVATLAALSETLPDDAWLDRLRLEDGELRLEGFAADAAGLAPLLDASPAFAAPRFTAPVAADAARAAERFSMALQVAAAGEAAP